MLKFRCLSRQSSGFGSRSRRFKRNTNVSSPSTCESQYCGEPRDLEVACSAADHQGSNFESCVWRTVSSHSSHHPQEVFLAQFSLYVHKGGLKPDSFHFISFVTVLRREKQGYFSVRSMWDRHSVKRSDGTGYPFWMTTLWKRCFMRPPPHTSLYWLARWKHWRSRLLSFTE